MDKEMTETKQIAGKEKPAEKEKPDVLARYRHAEGCKMLYERAKEEMEQANKELLGIMNDEGLKNFGCAKIKPSTRRSCTAGVLDVLPKEHLMHYVKPDAVAIAKQRERSKDFEQLTEPYYKETYSEYIEWRLEKGGTVTKKGK